MKEKLIGLMVLPLLGAYLWAGIGIVEGVITPATVTVGVVSVILLIISAIALNKGGKDE